jgi:hypothetical protein
MTKILKPFFLLHIAVCGILQTATAQITLTLTNSVPSIGDVFSVKSVDSVSLVKYIDPSPGTNQLWDYSAFAASTPAYMVKYLTPSATPYNTAFTSANLASFSTSDSSYTYFATNGKTLSKIGTGSSFAGAVTYSNPENVFSFPFSYNTPLQTDNYHFDLVLAAFQVTIIANGVDSIIPYATGKLKLPGSSTLYDVLCVKRKTVEVDSAGTFGNSISITTKFEFYNTANKYPLLTVTHGTDPFTQAPTLTATVLQNPMTTTAIEEAVAYQNNLLLYPNPANTELNIGNSNAKLLQIIDGTGRTVFSTSDPLKTVNTSTFPSGLYFVRADGRVAGKFIVQH